MLERQFRCDCRVVDPGGETSVGVFITAAVVTGGSAAAMTLVSGEHEDHAVDVRAACIRDGRTELPIDADPWSEYQTGIYDHIAAMRRLPSSDQAPPWESPFRS